MTSRRQPPRKAAEQRFESVFQFAPDALIIFTPEGVITQVNREAERLFGYTATELLGTPIEILVPTIQRAVTEQRHRTSEPLEPSRRSGAADQRIRAVPRDGRELFVEITLASLDSADGPAIIADIRDAGARWALEDQLLQSQRHEVVGQLAAAIAHDFNNLCQVIGASAEYALSQLPAGAPARREVEVIRNAGLRAASLIARLLAFGGGEAPTQPLDLNAAVSAMEPLLQRLMGPHTRVAIRLHEPVRPVCANPTEIEQLILNLAANARDAMPAGGTLAIELSTVTSAGSGNHWEPSVEHAQVVVRDTGIGMDTATRARIFEPFFSTKPPGKGTGLGLSTVHSIVQRCGGDIQCESEPGQGTVFTIHFPTIDGEVEVAPAVAGAEPDEDVHGHETILVIDDEEFLQSTLTRLLEQRGYRVLAAGSGEEAVRLVDALEGPLDLVVSDILMPGMSGWEAVEQIRERRDVRALFTSGSPDEVSADPKARQARFLAKPFSSLSLARTVREVLSAHDEP
jgi:PAS domain S-box-containing protein